MENKNTEDTNTCIKTKYIKYGPDLKIIIFAIFIALVITIILFNYKFSPPPTQTTQFYTTISLAFITLLGFFITAMSILLLLFDKAKEIAGNKLNVIRNHKSYPQIYEYFLRTIYVLGISSGVFLSFSFLILRFSFYAGFFIMFLSFLSVGYIYKSLQLLKTTINAFIGKIK
jgi:hypothetical protein